MLRESKYIFKKNGLKVCKKFYKRSKLDYREGLVVPSLDRVVREVFFENGSICLFIYLFCFLKLFIMENIKHLQE